MAVSAILARPAMHIEGDKTVHPFFSRAGGLKHASNGQAHEETDDQEYTPSDEIDITDGKPKRTESKRRAKHEKGTAKPKNQPTLGQLLGPKPSLPQPAELIDLETSEDSTENNGRHKRRRTNQFDSVEVGAKSNRIAADSLSGLLPDNRSLQAQVTASSPAPSVSLLPNEAVAQPAILSDKRARSPQVQIPASSPLLSTFLPPNEEALQQNGIEIGDIVARTPPRKVLRLTGNGKFSSPPPSKKPSNENSEPDSLPTKRRGRPRKAAQPPSPKQLLVRFSYGSDEASRLALGGRIESILQGETQVPVKKQASPRKRTPRVPARSTHPFFLGKSQEPQPPKVESPRKTSAVTPGKLRVQAFSDRPSQHIQESKEPEVVSALLKDRHLIKQPGARDPPFPAKDQVHVRGSVAFNVKQPLSGATFDLLFRRRKRKHARTQLQPHDSILSIYESHLAFEDDRQLRPDGFREPSNALRVPKRRLISGEQIAKEVVRELSVPMPASTEDELSLSSSQRAIHPALQRLYARIPQAMTAFDDSRGEPLSWTQKYAPMHSADVLQPNTEITVLKDWLKSLSVQAVGGAATQSKTEQPKRVDKAPKKKRKKKPDDLDDFLVDSDDDLREMTELPDNDDAFNIAGTRRTQASIVQMVQQNAKLSNAVLLSGPHGCGKSAAAYAVAKELGFKVFEISSSERRSGRDVLDKVGDLTENHNVRHHGAAPEELQTPLEPNLHDEAFQRDLESGRQGKMNAFFRPQVAKKKAAPTHAPTSQEPVKMRTTTQVKLKAIEEIVAKKPQKDQQQSLILLEEVDVLFKDDKDFWATVMRLMTTSKRPFIMTCNDEDAVPVQAMALHAILRFTQPLPDLAADYMLLLAAAEGHLLQRDALLALYRHNRSDLRASIAELNYWCQMGVGDPRGGLSWIYQRWPPGSDVDERGRKLRVTSGLTYQARMGFPSPGEVTPEGALLWLWRELDVEPASALGWTAGTELEDADVAAAANRRQSLRKLSKFSDALSAADAFSALGLPESAPFDPTSRDISEKARNHYIEGRSLLQVDERLERFDTTSAIYAATVLSAHRSHQSNKTSPCKGTELIFARALSDELASVKPNVISRSSFACFDTISAVSDSTLSTPGITQSVFDGPMNTLALDLAPYVRTIVHYDKALEEQRERLSLLNTDGRSSKRARTTRAARSALEGGQRSLTRKERWFPKELDIDAALATGGSSWPRLDHIAPSVTVTSKEETAGDGAPPSSAESA